MEKSWPIVKEQRSRIQRKNQERSIKKNNIYGVEIEEVAFGLSTTNMLIHGDGNSNIKLGSLFDNEDFFVEADPDIVTMIHELTI